MCDGVQIYLQTVIGDGLRCHVFGPFLSFVGLMATLLCGLSRYALHFCHWTDVAAGYVIGVVIAAYVVSTIRPFERMNIAIAILGIEITKI